MNEIFLDHLKLTVSIIAAVIFFIAFIAPFINKIIPYWRNTGKPSEIMLNRITIRFFLFILALHEAVFPLNRLLGYPVPPAVLIAVVIPVLLILSLLFVFSWRNHPEGVNGL
jgi:hypothetical protein